MKRILQAMDGVATKPVAGASEMSKYLRVVSEADINPSTNPRRADPKDQATTYIQFSSGLYSQSSIPDSISITADLSLPVTFTPLTQGADTSKTVQANINAANASLPKELQKTPEELSQIVGGADKPYAGPSINDINQPVGTPVQENSLDKFLSIIDKNNVDILNEGANPHKVSLPVQMAMQHYQKTTETTKPVGRHSTLGKYFHKVEEEFAESVAEERAHKRQLINQYASVIAERVMMKEAANPAQQAAIAIAKKKDQQADESLKSDNPCWKGYHPVGTKKKGGRTVPNCVPSESVISEKSTSEKQARTMAAAAHNPAFAKKLGIKSSVAKEFNKADTGTKQLSNAMKHKKKKVKENEIPGHSMGFTGGVGPGMQNYVVDEAPLDFDKNEPSNSMIYGHKSNPGTVQHRIMRARAQLKDLVKMAESDDLRVWESITRHFPELAMNIEEVRHGIEELSKIKKGGGRRSANIPTGLGEDANPIKQANAQKRAMKPKKTSSACKSNQRQVGVQNKNGQVVPKCAVVKKSF